MLHERDLMHLRPSRLRRTQSAPLGHLLHEGMEKGQNLSAVPSPRLRGEGGRRPDEVPLAAERLKYQTDQSAKMRYAVPLTSRWRVF